MLSRKKALTTLKNVFLKKCIAVNGHTDVVTVNNKIKVVVGIKPLHG